MSAGAELCLRFILQLDFDFVFSQKGVGGHFTFHRNQIVFCFSCGIFAFFQIDCCSRREKFLAAAGVLYMHGLDFSLQQNMGDEAVGAVEEDCFVNVLVLHKGIIAEMINNTPSLIASFTKLC